MSVDSMIDRFGKNFSIVRSGESFGSVKGLYNAEKSEISFPSNANVKPGDFLNSIFGESYTLTQVQVIARCDEPSHIVAKCVDKNKIQTHESSQIFNIGTVNNSVIGNSNVLNVTSTIDSIKSQIRENGGDDKESLNEIVELLEQILEERKPIEKGMFSKFSGVMERHSWITGAVASAILGVLML